MGKYNTNLAAEFYVLSTLHRLGVEASLTLGNKKTVDIFVALPSGEVATIDVKGVAGKHDWPAGNVLGVDRGRHFLALVSFEGKIADPTFPPEVWVVPYSDIEKFMVHYGARTNISRARVRGEGRDYRHAWGLIFEDEAA